MKILKPTLIFVYNADSGLFNTLTDIAHKLFSPSTYACKLCALTHSNVGMREEWRQFIASLENPMEFLHRDELKARYGIESIALPAIFKKEEEKVIMWLDADAINRCETLDSLKKLISETLPALAGSE